MFGRIAESYWDAVFGEFRWYRRLVGGRWERWIIDPALYGESMRGDTGWQRPGPRPDGAIGHPEWEDWST